jgi:AmmeMemoRadiSam system protein A
MIAREPAGRPWTAAERIAILDVARLAVRAAAHSTPSPPLAADLPPRLYEPIAAFVSLHRDAELRGCIGSTSPEGPLAALVTRMARAAATRDPRFPPLAPDELPGLHVEISLLSPLRPATVDDLEPATHGVSLRLGDRRAVLLPQVAAREGWNAATLLAHLCEKAGLPAHAWRDRSAVLLAFTVETVEDEI